MPRITTGPQDETVLMLLSRMELQVLALEQKSKHQPSFISLRVKGCFEVCLPYRKNLSDMVRMCSLKRRVKLEDIQH